jgi:hypothetical protein
LVLKERGAFSRESSARPAAKRAVTKFSRERWTSNCPCCFIGSMKLRPVALWLRQSKRKPRFLVAGGLKMRAAKLAAR